MGTNSKSYNDKVYKKYWWNPKAIKARSLRNKARRIMEKRGLVKKWDSKEVDHRNGTKAWNWAGNLRVISRLRNRIDWQKKSIKARLANNQK